MTHKRNPKKGLIIEYKTIFGKPPLKDRTNLILGTTKLELIGFVCQINNYLSKKKSVRFDYSLRTQNEILSFILRLEPNESRKELESFP